jgi:hypothetical protein
MGKKSWETSLDKCSHRNSRTPASSSNSNTMTMSSPSEFSDFSLPHRGGDGGKKTLRSLGGMGIKTSTSVSCPHQKWQGTTLLNSRVNVLVQILAIFLLLSSTARIHTVEGIKPSKILFNCPLE